MAYDRATGNMVLFGGSTGEFGGYNGVRLGATWVWNGSTWTRQPPAASPRAQYGEEMAYDAATSNVVLFGGIGGSRPHALADTWIWNGSTWTQQHPAASPPARDGAPMAYDAATGNVVLFGGAGNHGLFGDTWTWGSG